MSQAKSVIAVMSGKGGVGKSLVSALLAIKLAKLGKSVGLLDADITGPSIPAMFGVSEQPPFLEGKIVPLKSPVLGIKLISINFFLADESEAVIWRGPLISNAIKQFWEEVDWGGVDFLIVDLPPGTADAPLTVMQLLPLDGVVLVTSPQKLVVGVVKKAVSMSRKIGVKIIGLVENLSYVKCGSCGEKMYPFGKSRGSEISDLLGLEYLGSLPIDERISRASDTGSIENLEIDEISAVMGKVAKNAEEAVILIDAEIPPPAPENGARLVVPVTEGSISPVLSDTQAFIVFDILSGEITNRYEIAQSYGSDERTRKLILMLNADYAVTADMTDAAVNTLKSTGARVLPANGNDPESVVNGYLEVV